MPESASQTIRRVRCVDSHRCGHPIPPAQRKRVLGRISGTLKGKEAVGRVRQIESTESREINLCGLADRDGHRGPQRVCVWPHFSQ